MRYVFDTNTLLHYVRATPLMEEIDARFDPFGTNNYPILSIVTVAEIGVIARLNNWGDRRIQLLQEIISRMTIIGIDRQIMIDAYIDIDVFSQIEFSQLRFKNSARNMGKNDLWIAAATHVAGAELLTTDQDFTHLHERFFRVHYLKY